MKFCIDIHGPQRMNLIDLSDPLTFSVGQKKGQTFYLSSEISQHLPDALTQTFVQTFMVARGLVVVNELDW